MRHLNICTVNTVKSVLKKTIPLSLLSIFCLSTQAQEVYTNGFETMPTGLVDDRDIKDAWDTRYAKGPDEGRVRIVTDSISGKAGRVKYPAFGNQSTPSGATWETDIQVSADELYMAYWVKFDDDFQFVKGGKLPGLAGSTSFPYGDNDFTTRLMWREEGKLEFYMHGFRMNNEEGSEPYRLFWDDFGVHARVIPGQWHHIEIHQKLNTPGLRNGRLRGWLDGVLMVDDTSNSGVRASGQSSTKINQLYFSTFFGGSSAPVIQWQPTRDVYAVFDEFIVSRQRIGADGDIPDLPPGNLAPQVSFDSPASDLTLEEGYTTSFEAIASDADGSIDNLKLYIDGNFIRQESVAPYVWGDEIPSNADELNGLTAGTYTVSVVATDNEGATAEDSFTLTVISGEGDSPDPIDNECLSVAVANSKSELDLTNYSCIEFSQNLSGRRLAVWDSDVSNACDFRGTLSSVNGSGSLVVPDNYEATTSVSGTIFNVSNRAGNSCRLLKIRAW